MVFSLDFQRYRSEHVAAPPASRASPQDARHGPEHDQQDEGAGGDRSQAGGVESRRGLGPTGDLRVRHRDWLSINAPQKSRIFYFDFEE
jgi:hypothetical protein